MVRRRLQVGAALLACLPLRPLRDCKVRQCCLLVALALLSEEICAHRAL